MQLSRQIIELSVQTVMAIGETVSVTCNCHGKSANCETVMAIGETVSATSNCHGNCRNNGCNVKQSQIIKR